MQDVERRVQTSSYHGNTRASTPTGIESPTGMECPTYKLGNGDAAEHRGSHVLQGTLHTLRPAARCHQEGMHYVRTELHSNAQSHGQVHNRHSVQLDSPQVHHTQQVHQDHGDHKQDDAAGPQACREGPANSKHPQQGSPQQPYTALHDVQVLLKEDVEDGVRVHLDTQLLVGSCCEVPDSLQTAARSNAWMSCSIIHA